MTEPMDWVYTGKVKEHFINPRNVLDDGSSYNEDGRGLVGNIKCGDQMLMVIKVDRQNNTIKDCRWKTYGCASAIASTSILSEKVKGMKIEDAYSISPKDIAADLGGLPEHKIHCSVLGDKALRAAIDDYYKRNGMEDKITREPARTICRCVNVTDREIESAVLEGARTFQALQEKTKAGTVCGQCKEEILKLMEGFNDRYFK
jgi:nitrogen fixation protein NifU and related proteins